MEDVMPYKSRSKALDKLEMSIAELTDIKTALDESAIVAVTDKKGIIISVNARFCEISKYDKSELIGQDHRILNSGHHPKSFFKEMWKTIGNGNTWQGEICNRAKDGSIYWVQTTIVPFLDEKGKPYQYISIRTDITAQKNIKKITHIAYHDDLTGLPNRRNLIQRMKSEIEEARKKNNKFAVFLLDINRFKHINDGLGHKAGDLFLVEIARRLMSVDIQSESFYRLNGDEFVYILKDIDRLDEMINRILSIFKESYVFFDYEFYASGSIGITIFPDHAQNFTDLLKCADSAMYEAKKRKGNTYIMYEKNMSGFNDKMLMLETKLHNAIQNDLFELHYQPKINIQTGEMEGMEALIRWNDKDLGFMPPDQFIPFAEECGLIIDIGEWVLKKAALQAKEWNALFKLNLRVAVNISPKHLAEKNFVNRLKEILDEIQVEPTMLEIEITEMSMMDQNEILISKIRTIKEMGITISIDDFGTGYSSLSYLKKFPVDALKIDRSFIQNISNEESDVAMVAAIIKLAQALNLEVVAEGVEEVKGLQILKEHDCKYVQGYYFSKPLNVKDFTKKLEEQTLIKN